MLLSSGGEPFQNPWKSSNISLKILEKCWTSSKIPKNYWKLLYLQLFFKDFQGFSWIFRQFSGRAQGLTNLVPLSRPRAQETAGYPVACDALRTWHQRLIEATETLHGLVPGRNLWRHANFKGQKLVIWDIYLTYLSFYLSIIFEIFKLFEIRLLKYLKDYR